MIRLDMDIRRHRIHKLFPQQRRQPVLALLDRQSTAKSLQRFRMLLQVRCDVAYWHRTSVGVVTLTSDLGTKADLGGRARKQR